MNTADSQQPKNSRIGSSFDIQAIIERAKEVILKPELAWEKIKSEESSITDIYKNYLAPLAAIGPIALWLKMSVFGITVGIAPFATTVRIPFFAGLVDAIINFCTSLLITFLAALILEKLAPKFGATTTLNNTFKLLAYAATPAMVAGIFYLIPVLGPLIILIASIYSLYLLYKGALKMIEVPQENRLSYFAVSIVAILITGFVVSLITYSVSPARADLANIEVGNKHLNELEENLKNFQRMMPKP